MAKKQRSALGKGLNALLPSSAEAVGDYEQQPYFLCEIDSICPNPSQPRKDIDDHALHQLSASIQEKGVLLPLVVRQLEDEEMFEIIAGERRWRAAKLAGLAEVPVLVKDVSPVDRLEMALIENIQRQDLNPLEEAEAYCRLVKEFGLTQEEVAKRVGKERSTVANTLRILHLPDFAKKDLAGGLLTMGHARVLLSLNDPEEQKSVRDEIVEKGFTVRQAEALAKKRKSRKGAAPQIRKTKSDDQLPDSYCQALSNDLVRHLGTKSRILQNGTRGKLEIEYYSADDLERLMSLIIKQ